MTMLHFYRKFDNQFPHLANGVGNVSHTEEFLVTITWGTVRQGEIYQIRRGTAPCGDWYNCLASATTGGQARFRLAEDVALMDINEDFLGATYALHAALLASTKTVNIEIAKEDLARLKSADYKLCFAKKVAQGNYNVVWQSYSKYLVRNEFSWTPQYQLFGSNQFHTAVQVKVQTNLVRIGLGEESTLDENGVLGQPITGGPETCITVINNYGSIHPGLNQLSTGIDGSQTSTPVYVAPAAMVTGDAILTPVEKVLVWFEQNIETSTMFSAARSRSVEIDLTYSNAATRLYKDHQWRTA